MAGDCSHVCGNMSTSSADLDVKMLIKCKINVDSVVIGVLDENWDVTMWGLVHCRSCEWSMYGS